MRTFLYIMAAIIIAHRGGALLGTENSLSCIELGIQSGAYMVEIDVHQTADKQLVVCHDQKVNRTTNGRGKIEEMTLAEVQSLRLLRPDGSVSDEVIPTLNQVLDLCKGRCRLLIEIKKWRKDQYAGIEQAVDSALKAHGMENQVAVQSFNDDVLFTMHAINPSLRLEKLLICRIGSKIIDGGWTDFSFEKYDFIASFNIFRLFASERFIKEVHAQGKEVKVWTVDKPEDAPEGVDGIISDRPDLFIH